VLRRLSVFLLFLIAVVLALYIFRAPLLRSFATFLIREDSMQKADAIFVLSGGGYDRGNEAVKIFRQNYAPKIICTGGNPVVELKVFNMDTLEADMTTSNLKRQGIADSVITEIREGTSTKEEAALIVAYCQSKKFKRVMVLSSKLHTKRVSEVFRGKLRTANIELIVRGAPSSRFNEMEWWQSEEGLIAINNEWLKTFYYWWKY
jgi:uncharacterized SAM-binding protein YcdF (DUF218 family)